MDAAFKRPWMDLQRVGTKIKMVGSKEKTTPSGSA